jgi:translation elongation factor EF-Ts
MKISMDQLKQLRDMTLAPMKDCKDALVESE